MQIVMNWLTLLRHPWMQRSGSTGELAAAVHRILNTHWLKSTRIEFAP